MCMTLKMLKRSQKPIQSSSKNPFHSMIRRNRFKSKGSRICRNKEEDRSVALPMANGATNSGKLNHRRWAAAAAADGGW